MKTGGASVDLPVASRGPSALAAQVLLVNACMYIFGIVLLLMGSLLPTLRVSAEHAGSLGSLPLAGVLTATILIGPVFDKLGAKPVLTLGLALVAAALALMPSVSGYPALAAAALAYGFGGGILNTVTNALVSLLRASSRASSLNLLGFSFSLGAITAPLILSAAHGRLSSAAILRLLAALPALILLFMLPMKFPGGLRAGMPPKVLLRSVRHPAVWLFGILLLFESANENCVFVWAAKLVAEVLRAPGNLANLALVAVTVALGAGRLLASMAARRLASRSLLLTACALVAAGAGIVIFAARTPAGYIGMIAGFAILGLGMAPVFPTTLSIAGDRFPEETGTVFGAIMAVALIGGTAGPLVGGWLAARNATEILLVPLTAAIAVALLTLFAGRPQKA
jgi:MFS transporter, FHS family, glucose/mannose:H+ symporter